jgi:hypothetical protein
MLCVHGSHSVHTRMFHDGRVGLTFSFPFLFSETVGRTLFCCYQESEPKDEESNNKNLADGKGATQLHAGR